MTDCPKVVILCGGLGTRLREETEFRPKPMVEIGGRPILWHIMKIFAHYGFRDFVLCLGYRGNAIKDYFLNYDALGSDFTIELSADRRIEYHGTHAEQGFRVTLADTGQTTMTGGRVKRVARFIEGDDFLVTYGDGVADVDVTELLRFHRAHGRLATVTTVHPLARFGMLDVEPGGEVRWFVEKPKAEGWISAGFFVFRRRVLDYLEGDQCVMEREPLERLAAERQLMAYRHPGCFFAMDTYREYEALNRTWDSGQVPWKVWT
ncbi:MAG: glucose-1-phosphate cytidylyltransferase [Thermoguttaceae bacterium]|jgi:glucose-1-phosphate cytidylyltransferase